MALIFDIRSSNAKAIQALTEIIIEIKHVNDSFQNGVFLRALNHKIYWLYKPY